MSVIRAIDLDSSSIKLNNFSSKNGRKFINIDINNKPIKIQTPTMISPYGYSEFRDKNSNQLQTLSVDLSFGSDDKNVGKFQEVVEQIEDKILKEVSANSLEYFGDEFTVAEIKKAKMFKSQIKHHKEGKYAPVVKLKLPHMNETFTGKVYNEKKEEVDVEYITKGSKVTAIVELRSIWIIDNSFGITFKAVQLRVEKPDRLDDYAFIDDEQLSNENNNPLHGENDDDVYDEY